MTKKHKVPANEVQEPQSETLRQRGNVCYKAGQIAEGIDFESL